MEAKLRRRQALQDTRQAMVLMAAKKVIEREGLEGASVRQIALEAGYTPGALYAFFDSKQALLLALLEESLGMLSQELTRVKVPKGQLAQSWLLMGETWIRWLALHPQEVQLLLFCVGGTGRPQPKVQATWEALRALRMTLQPLADGLAAFGLPDDSVSAEIDALMAHGMGLLISQMLSRPTIQEPWNADPEVTPASLPPRSIETRPITDQFTDYMRRLLLVVSLNSGKTALPEMTVGPNARGPQPDLFT